LKEIEKICHGQTRMNTDKYLKKIRVNPRKSAAKKITGGKR